MHQNYTTEQIQLVSAPIACKGQVRAVPFTAGLRQLQSPRRSIFCHPKLPHHDGHDYVPPGRAFGTLWFPVMSIFLLLPEANVWLCDNTVQCLQRLIAHHRQQFDIPVIGITGSNGKTIVKNGSFNCCIWTTASPAAPRVSTRRWAFLFRLAIAAGAPAGYLRSGYLAHGRDGKAGAGYPLQHRAVH